MSNRRRNPPRRVVAGRPGGQEDQPQPDEPEIILHPDGDRVDLNQPPENRDDHQPPNLVHQQQPNPPAQDRPHIGNIVDALILELQRRGIALPGPGPAPVGEVVQPALLLNANAQNNQLGEVPRPQLNDTPMLGRYRAKDPPTFGGGTQNVNEWLAAYEDVADFNGWSEEIRRQHVKISLTGVAIEWYRSYKQPDDWPSFKRSLINAFCRHDYVEEQRQKLMSRNQGANEPVIDYCFNVIYLCSTVDPNMPEKEKVKHLIDGLQPAIAEAIFPFLPENKTVNDVLDRIRIHQMAKTAALRSRLGVKVETTASKLADESTTPVAGPSSGVIVATKTDLMNLQNTMEEQFRKMSGDLQREIGRQRSASDRFKQVSRAQQSSEQNNQLERSYDARRKIGDTVEVKREGGTFSGQQRGSTFKPNRWTEEGRPICRVCDQPGHLARSCRQLKRKPEDNEGKETAKKMRMEPDAGLKKEN